MTTALAERLSAAMLARPAVLVLDDLDVLCPRTEDEAEAEADPARAEYHRR